MDTFLFLLLLFSIDCFACGSSPSKKEEPLPPKTEELLPRYGKGDFVTCLQNGLERQYTKVYSFEETKQIIRNSSTYQYRSGKEVPFYPDETKYINYYVTDRTFALNQGYIFENSKILDLPDGTYTYVLMLDTNFYPYLSFGRVHDAVEFGVKHIHLANENQVVIAGELLVDRQTNRFKYNLESGTFTRDSILETPYLQRCMHGIFHDDTEGKIQLQYTTNVLLPFTPPSPTMLGNLCTSPEFKKQNDYACNSFFRR